MSRAALRYAKAALSLASEQNKADVVNSDMKLISETLRNSSDLNNALQSPVIRSADKKEVLASVFKTIDGITDNLITMLITNKRIALLAEVASKYNHLYKVLKDTQTAKVTTAAPLTKTLEIKVLDKIKALTGKTTAIESVVDESILGGFILRIGDLQYDASVANKLNKLKREFTLN